MRVKFGAALAALLMAAPAAAEPVALHCTIKGPHAAIFGPLSVVVDLAARTVQIEAPEKMPGFRWHYRHGDFAPILAQGPADEMAQNEAVTQFVYVTPDFVMLGWRWSDGDLGQVMTFDRAALEKPGAACRWRSSFEFAVG